MVSEKAGQREARITHVERELHPKSGENAARGPAALIELQLPFPAATNASR